MSTPEILTIQQTAQSLQVSTRTIYRLIKEGRLPASKIGHTWRIKRTDLEKFIGQRLTYYGPFGIAPRIYRAEVLDKYRQDRTKYYLDEEAFAGKLGLKGHLKELLLRRAAGNPHKGDPVIAPPLFCEIRFQKTRLKDGTSVVVVRPNELEKISAVPEEQKHWIRFLIPKPEV